MALFVYDPERILVAWNGVIIQGFMDGTMVSAEHEEDAVTRTVGGQGQATATINANRCGSVTFTLVQGSPVNDILSNLAASNRAPGSALIVGPLLIKDLQGTTLVSAAEAWIKKVAKTEYAKEATGREWTLDTSLLALHTGGAVK